MLRSLRPLAPALCANWLLALAGAAPAAALPATVGIQGFVSAQGGGPAPDGSYNVIVAFYDAETGGTQLGLFGPTGVQVTNGIFATAVGDAALAQKLGVASPWVEVLLGADKLPRQKLHAVPFALRAGIAATLDCSGCVQAGHIDPNVFKDLAKSGALAAVASTGDYKDLKNPPDLTAYAKLADLAKVAATGKYADLDGGPDLSGYATKVSLAAVATSGKYGDLKGVPDLMPVALTGAYKDLTGVPPAAQLGKACGTALVVKGLKSDGSLECVAAMDPAALPKDGLDEISNGLLSNQFVDSFSGKPGVPIPDNKPTGESDMIDFPDIGIAQALAVTVDLTNSDISKLVVTLFDPDGKEYVLYEKGSNGDALKATYPAPTKPVLGDLTQWVGKNPKGKWYLKVVDSGFKNNANDGQINSWTIAIQTLSNQKVEAKGALVASNAVHLNGPVWLGGRRIDYPTAPQFALDVATWPLVGSGNFPNGWIKFPFTFDKQPVFIGTVDESLDNHGTVWTRLLKRGTNRIGIRTSDYGLEALHWLAIEPGVHKISGKTVMAGIQTGVGNGSVVKFPQAFDNPPVVLLYVDESVDNSGSTYIRLINAVGKDQFQFYCDSNIDAVHWIALDAGAYEHGRYKFWAGTANLNNGCSGENCMVAWKDVIGTDFAPGRLPGVVATLWETNNSGSVWIRLREVFSDKVRLYIDGQVEKVNLVAFEQP